MRVNVEAPQPPERRHVFVQLMAKSGFRASGAHIPLIRVIELGDDSARLRELGYEPVLTRRLPGDPEDRENRRRSDEHDHDRDVQATSSPVV